MDGFAMYRDPADNIGRRRAPSGAVELQLYEVAVGVPDVEGWPVASGSQGATETLLYV